jgi:hypothetical protein
MRQRRPLLLLGAWLLALVGIAGGLLVLVRPPLPGVTRANYERIQYGMTAAEVQSLLGGPPEKRDVFSPLRDRGLMTEDRWQANGLTVRVQFTDKGRVYDKYLAGDEEGFIALVRRLFRR